MRGPDPGSEKLARPLKQNQSPPPSPSRDGGRDRCEGQAHSIFFCYQMNNDWLTLALISQNKIIINKRWSNLGGLGSWRSGGSGGGDHPSL